jgi:pimeloyl-[acyl-carrier protein] methyl ester esterase
LPDLSISGVAGVLQGFLEARSLKDALLVGWSLGARVCLGYCERFGTSHLRGVALVDTAPRMLPGDDWQPDVDTRFSLEGLERTRARWRDDRRALIKDVATRGFSDPLAHQSDIAELVLASELADDRAFELLEDGYRRDLRDALSALSIPVLLLFGGRSRNVTPANREYMARTLPHAEVIVFPESGHNVFLEEPEAFADAIGRFGRRV